MKNRNLFEAKIIEKWLNKQDCKKKTKLRRNEICTKKSTKRDGI